VAVSFDTIPHEPLIDAVAERIADGSVLRLIRLFLEALIQDGYRVVRPRAGTPQGGVMTPPHNRKLRLGQGRALPETLVSKTLTVMT
jgi:retron-type reverse transcriptase